MRNGRVLIATELRQKGVEPDSSQFHPNPPLARLLSSRHANPIAHFEIQADDVQRAIRFYEKRVAGDLPRLQSG